MSRNASIQIEVPIRSRQIKLPKGVDDRLRSLLDKQDRGLPLTPAEKREAQGLVELSEMLSLMKVRSQRVSTGTDA